jgi:hypothetical protein
MRLAGILLQRAEVAEQADAHDSKSCTLGYVGSIPTFGKEKPLKSERLFVTLNRRRRTRNAS